MNKTNDKYQMVTGIHGNERLPILAMANCGVSQIVANPLAVSRNVRFIDRDMNASFGTVGKTYEEIRAREVLKIIPNDMKVIDLHTTMGVKEPFVIVVDKKMLMLAKSLGISRIVFMRYNNKGGHALINHVDGVSVECGLHEDSEAFRVATEVVKSLIVPKLTPCTIYEVYESIEKPGEYTNFKLHKDGFIPVFAMKNSYNNFGLKAKIINEKDL